MTDFSRTKARLLPVSAVMIFTVLAALSTQAVATEVVRGRSPERPSIGMPGSTDDVAQTIDIEISDSGHFSPATIRVRPGETVRLVVSNAGRVNHELILGTANTLRHHYALITRQGADEHAAPNLLALEPGQTGELVWRFNRPGQVLFGCLLPGHYDENSRGTIAVSTFKTPGTDSSQER